MQSIACSGEVSMRTGASNTAHRGQDVDVAGIGQGKGG